MARTVHIDGEDYSPAQIKDIAQAALYQAQAKAAKAEARYSLQEARKSGAEAELAEMVLADARALDERERASDEDHRHYALGDISAGSVKSCLATLSRWHRLDARCAITLTFNSPGGSVIDGLALWDYLTYLKNEGHHLTTVCQGMAASMGGILFQAGDRRIMGAESVILVHEIAFGAGGKIGDVEDTVEFAKLLTRRVLRLFASRTKMSEAQIIRRWTRKDWWLDSDSALELGFCDEVR